MAKVEGGRLVAKTLSELGVRDIFTLGGGHINPVYNACGDYGIRIIDTRHEQGAAMAADAYGRLMRKPGVCLVTAGPGFTNALTGVAGAYLSNAPLLLLSGRSGLEENDRLSLQEINQEAMAAPVTKWTRTVHDPLRIPEYITSAYKRALSGRPGPVYLGMSYEVLYPKCDENKVSSYDAALPERSARPAEKTVASAIRLLKSSKKPLAIAGSGAWYSGSEKVLKDFIQRTGIPLYTLNLGRGIVSDDHPLCLGAASPSAQNAFRELSGEADLILLLGVRLSIYMGFGKTFNPKAKVIQIDINPGEHGRNIAADTEIHGDLTQALKDIMDYIDHKNVKPNFTKWQKRVLSNYKIEQKKAEKIRTSNKIPIHPVRVAKAVEEVTSGDAIVAVDGGDCQAWTDGSYKVMHPGHYIKGGLLGCMGVGVPFAIGAKAAMPHKSVVLITGDGAVGMNFMEFNTAVRHKLPFVTVVCNDKAWGMTKHQLEITYGKKRPKVGVDLGNTPFHKLVEVMGGYGELVENPKDLEGAIERGLSSGVPSLINVMTDPGAVSGATFAITEMMMSSGKK